MRYDECHTFLEYVRAGTLKSLFTYESPNNHVLHTLAAFVSRSLFGSQPWALRLPAYLAGVAIIPAAAIFARRLSRNALAGLLAATLAAGSGILVEYSVNARGYSMQCLAVLIQGLFAVHICRDVRRLRSWIGWTLAGALGLCVIPTMAYPIAVLCVAMVLAALVRGLTWRSAVPVAWRLAVFGGLMVALAALFYLPVFRANGIHAVVANEYTRAKPLQLALSGNWRVIQDTVRDWLRDTSWLWQALVGAGALASLAAAAAQSNALLALPLIGIGVSLAMVLAQQVVPFPRTWLFLLSVVLVCASCGLTWLLEVNPWRRAARAATRLVAALVLLAAVLGAVRTCQRPYLISEDPKTLVDAEEICKDVYAAAGGRHAIFMSMWAGWPVRYYSLVNHGPVPEGLPAAAVFVVVGDRETLPEVLDSCVGGANLSGRLRMWKRYPHASVYIASPP